MTDSNLSRSLPFICHEGAGKVYLRSLIIYTNGVERDDLLRGFDETACFYDGGDLFVCNGDPKTDNSGNIIDPRTYDASADASASNGTTARQTYSGNTISSSIAANLSITATTVAPNFMAVDGEGDVSFGMQNGILDSDWCQARCEEETFYKDADGDGYGSSQNGTWVGCEEDLPAGYTSNNTDCDDNDNNAYPGNDEVCDGVDNDCDGDIDEDATDGTNYYTDADGDGFGDSTTETTLCEDPADGSVTDGSDCDDTNAEINPDATEVCDGEDNDCDGDVDEDVGTTWYIDVDGDGYGTADSTLEQCDQPTGYVATDDDCDDSDSSISPAGTEICDDGIDQDCSGADTECSSEDADGDGYTTADGDCDDNDATVNPGATDTCGDGIDQDCSGDDASCDPEICDDGLDNDGDGLFDCEDDACDTFYTCNGVGPEEDCTDQIDNDGDGAADCADADCAFEDACVSAGTETDCSNDTDDDNDGLTDCEDTDCADVIVDEDGNTCLDLQLTPVGDAGYLAGGGGCSCNLTANGQASLADMMPVFLGMILLGFIGFLRTRARQNEMI